MKPPVDVGEITSRATRYWMEDGLVEIWLGLLLILLGGGALARMALPRSLSLVVLTDGLLVASFAGLSWGFKKLRERITFPRSGYAVHPKQTRKDWIRILTTAAAFGVTFQLLAPPNRMAVPGSAVLIALALVVPGSMRDKRPRMIVEGLLALAFGAYLSWFTGLSGWKGVMALMVMMGVSMAVIGALRFKGFQKTHPILQETDA